MKTYVTVCRNAILRNLKQGRNDPTVRVSKGKHGKPRRYRNYRKGKIRICGDMRQKPMPWGARVWVEIEE
jgi:hypothetical protein